MLYYLVLPNGPISQCRMDRPSPLTGYYHVPSRVDVLPLHEHFRKHGNRRNRKCRCSRWYREPDHDPVVCILRVRSFLVRIIRVSLQPTPSKSVLAGPTELPGFWIFMYRVNPFTYVVEGFLGTSLANAPVQCSPDEFVTFSAPNSSTCRTYLSDYLNRAGGYLEDPDSTECRYCALSETNGFLSSINVSWDNRWRDFGFMWVYCIFNIVAAVFLYWLVRVPKRKSGKSS